MSQSNTLGSDIPSFCYRLRFFEGQSDSSSKPLPDRTEESKRSLSELFSASSLNETKINIPRSTSVTSSNTRRGNEQLLLNICGGVEGSSDDEEDKNQDNWGDGEDILKGLLTLALLKDAVDSASRTKSR